jgi:hypothetical protein
MNRHLAASQMPTAEPCPATGGWRVQPGLPSYISSVLLAWVHADKRQAFDAIFHRLPSGSAK